MYTTTKALLGLLKASRSRTVLHCEAGQNANGRRWHSAYQIALALA